VKPASAPQPEAVKPANPQRKQTIEFLEAKVRSDPDDFIAYNMLASEYLREMRETGDIAYLELALRSAKASLAAVPAEQNKGGLAVLAQAEFSAHDFAGSRDHAKRLAEIDPGKGYVYQLLGDAHFELGEYDEARAAFAKMEEFGGFQAITQVAIEQRLARLALLEGDDKKAKDHIANAIRIAERPPRVNDETVAFCHWQAGELEFAAGNHKAASAHYQTASKIVPNYLRASASLARVMAAEGDLQGAIKSLEDVTARMPDPAYVALLGDIYAKAGRVEEAARQYALVEQIARLGAAKGGLYDRELALFYANHDLNVEQACESASAQYQIRRDIYGADIYAWACHKAGRLEEARTAIAEALRFGTQDARLFYHAGMIEKAAGNKDTARSHLTAALKLNPGFDPAQADLARLALRELE
jgi:tetratricopeptide (TPR) repeat protein